MSDEPRARAETTIRPIAKDDVAAVVEIYNQAVDDTVAIWNNDHVDEANRLQWIESHDAAGLPILVAEVGGEIAGYASLSVFRDFQGFAHTAENSIYVHPRFQRRGIASLLLEKIVESARELKLHVVVAAIEGSNEASLTLHSRLGFRSAGVIPQAGIKFGRWLDLHFMYLLLEDTGVNPQS